MLESISGLFLNTTNREFRVLLAIENEMRFYEWVPIEEIGNFTNYVIKEVEYILSNLARNKLIQRNISAYSGYRISFEAYDLLALNAFVKRGSVNAIGDVIGVGKESLVYEATGGITDRHVVIKFHREGRLYASRLAANREFNALKKLYPDVSVPEPIDYNRHAIVMSVIKGQALAHTRMNEPQWYLDEILNQVKKAYLLGIIHGDLSEFNVFINPQGCEIIDWPQYITPVHSNAAELLTRDIDNILTFFMRKYRIKRDRQEVIKEIFDLCQKK